MAVCPMPPCTATPLPALLQHWLHGGFWDLLLPTDPFVPAQLPNGILAPWAADAQLTNLH